MCKKIFVKLSRTVYAQNGEKRSVLRSLLRSIAPSDDNEKQILMVENKSIDEESLSISQFFDKGPNECTIAR